MTENSSQRTLVRPEDLAPVDFYKLLNSCVVPRPIAWVSTLDKQGIVNLAPYSLFMVVSSAPPVVMFSSLQREKDSARNARATGEFTINVTSVSQLAQVNATSASVPADVDEAKLAGVAMEPGTLVSCPRVAQSVVAIECKTREIQQIGNGFMVLGNVLGIVTNNGVINDKGLVPPQAIDVLGKLGGPLWAGLGDTIQAARPE